MQRATAHTPRIPRRRLLALAGVGLIGGGLIGGGLIGGLASGIPRAAAQDLKFFRIATGTTGGTYFPLGGLIANAISNPPGSRPCDKGGSCGIPGLIAVAQATLGSVENIAMLRTGSVEAAMVQANIAHWAHTGTGLYEGQAPLALLRSLGTLYSEAVHIVARADGGIRTVADLRGKAVSLGEEGSGTLVDARAVLAAYGLKDGDVKPHHLKPATAGDRLAKGELDAFFIVGGHPVAAVTDVAGRVPVRLVAFDGAEADRLMDTHRFFSDMVIPSDTYPGVSTTRTIAVGAELLVRGDLNVELVYGVTRALWHENTRRLLSDGHPKGRAMDPASAVASASVPLHPGAERYYREAGLIGEAGNEPAPGEPSQP